MSIDIKIEDIQPQWTSVFHVSKGFTGTVGDRIPVRMQIMKAKIRSSIELKL